MFTFAKDKNNNVTRFEFEKPLEHYYIPHSWELVHEELAEKFASMAWNYRTVIVVTEPMEEKLWDDPKYAHISYSTYCSEVEERARELAREKSFFSDAQIEKIFKKHNFPKERYNWEDDEDDEEDRQMPIVTELKDAIYDAQVKMLYPKIIQEFKDECRYDYDDESGEEVKLAPQAFAKKWKERELEIFLPRVHEESHRAYPNIPSPFGHSTSLGQYFFIESEDKIEWVFGAWIGSSTRYAHGLMGHVFATLTKKYKKTIPTYYFKITNRNEFRYIKQWESFKVERHELTGNYPADWEESEPLFKGMLFSRD
jgi:hypothetical protein